LIGITYRFLGNIDMPTDFLSTILPTTRTYGQGAYEGTKNVSAIVVFVLLAQDIYAGFIIDRRRPITRIG